MFSYLAYADWSTFSLELAKSQVMRRIGGKKKRKKSKNETKKRKPLSQRKLPHWCIYIGYALVFLAVASSAFFTILYAFQWGREKSEEWLVTFFLSFSESVFLLQPAKVSSDVTVKAGKCPRNECHVEST